MPSLGPPGDAVVGVEFDAGDVVFFGGGVKGRDCGEGVEAAEGRGEGFGEGECGSGGWREGGKVEAEGVVC